MKRSKALQPLSREHHHGLLLAWKIREGFKRNIDPQRIKKYADWFWEGHLKPHFEFEEKYVFPILDRENDLIHTALEHHKILKELFRASEEPLITLSSIESMLDTHIRFEERILFPEIQKEATPEQMIMIEVSHSEIPLDKWEDEFWDD